MLCTCKIKSPAHVSGSRNKWNTKNLFSPETSFSCLWVTGYASHSESSTQGSMGSYATVLVYPLQLASRGWSSPAILPPQDWTENLTVNSPTLQPLNQVADEISCLMCLYIAQDVPGLQENSKIKNLNFVNIGIRTQYLGVVCVEQTP